MGFDLARDERSSRANFFDHGAKPLQKLSPRNFGVILPLVNAILR
jgi:hypothetical protein